MCTEVGQRQPTTNAVQMQLCVCWLLWIWIHVQQEKSWAVFAYSYVDSHAYKCTCNYHAVCTSDSGMQSKQLCQLGESWDSSIYSCVHLAVRTSGSGKQTMQHCQLGEIWDSSIYTCVYLHMLNLCIYLFCCVHLRQCQVN